MFTQCTAWRLIMAQTSPWHKMEDGIHNIFLTSVVLMHFCIPYKEVEMMTAIN